MSGMRIAKLLRVHRARRIAATRRVPADRQPRDDGIFIEFGKHAGRDQRDEDSAEDASSGDRQIEHGQVFGRWPSVMKLAMADHADHE
jgi:hypothetical protein